MNDNDRKHINEANHELVKDWQPRVKDAKGKTHGVFSLFADLSAVPRESGHVAQVADFLMAFAKKHGFEESYRDDIGNVIIRKPAQKSASGKGVILQAHQDMVCVKKAGVDHDFRLDPIELTYDGEWLRAKGTTLGADDGIGVAMALGVLLDSEMSHPPLEALFTVDEETDMKGAKAVKGSSLQGETLINLDAEDLGVAYVSSAAGATAVLELPLSNGGAGTDRKVLRRVAVRGLLGGHSGLEINKARGNAYVLLARFLAEAVKPVGFSLHSFARGEDGGADNAIPDRALAEIGLSSEADAETVARLAGEWTEIFRHEYRAADPKVEIVLETAGGDFGPALPASGRDRLLDLVRLLPLGVFRFIQAENFEKIAYGDLLVETSCNMGIVKTENGLARLTLLARSSTATVLDDLMRRFEALARMAGGTLTVTNRTTGWEMPAELTPVQRLFKAQGLTCLGVHAGLECGCLVGAKPGLDAVSVGPDLNDVHSPKEQLHVGSVNVLWGQLARVLAQL